MSRYTVNQACWALNVNPRTVHKWAEEQGIEWHLDPADKRVRYLTEEQMQVLADYYGRVLRPPVTIEDMYQELEMFKRRVAEALGTKDRPDNAGNLSKGYCVRLSARHGIKDNTCEKWQWPSETRFDDEQALIYARGRMGPNTRQNWHECEGYPECPCHRVDMLRNDARHREPGAR